MQKRNKIQKLVRRAERADIVTQQALTREKQTVQGIKRVEEDILIETLRANANAEALDESSERFALLEADRRHDAHELEAESAVTQEVQATFWEHMERTRHIEAARGAERAQLQQQIRVLLAQNSVQDDIDQAAVEDTAHLLELEQEAAEAERQLQAVMASVSLEKRAADLMFEALCNVPAELLESLEKKKASEMLRRQRILAEEENASRSSVNVAASDDAINTDSTSTRRTLEQMSSSVLCALKLAASTAQIVEELSPGRRATLAAALQNNQLVHTKSALWDELREFQVDLDQPVLCSVVRECELALGGLLDQTALADAIQSTGQIVRQMTKEGKDKEAVAVQYMQERMEQQSVQNFADHECGPKQGLGILKSVL